jgi:FAD/FMN-containing dehydrogenase
VFSRIEDPSIIAGYLTDASNLPGRADVLVRPRTAEELGEVLAHCQQQGIGATITAARTSTTGGAVPNGGWLVSTELLSRIHHIGPGSATADGGVFLGALQDEVEATGRFYPPDPTSRHECTLGASIACNASGARSFKYGPTRPWVEALQVVLPTGELIEIGAEDPVPADWPVPQWTEPSTKTAAGYPPARRLLDLFIGQEGTLGVITRATIRLIPAPPEVMGVLAWFVDRQTALTFVELARAAARADATGALAPRCLEYLDHNCLRLAGSRAGDIPQGARVALFCEQELHGDPDAHMEAWWEALEATGALADHTLVTTDDAGRARLHALRHAVPAGINERVVANGMPKVGTDLAVPDAALEQMMAAYERAPMDHALFGHVGDNHLHLNLLPASAAELQIAKDFYDELAALAISLGGTVSAEHGIGKLKRAHLRQMVGDRVMNGFSALKQHLDPGWILGRGNVLEMPTRSTYSS